MYDIATMIYHTLAGYGCVRYGVLRKEGAAVTSMLDGRRRVLCVQTCRREFSSVGQVREVARSLRATG